MFFGSARGPRSLRFPLGALGFGVGASRGAAVGADRARSVRFRSSVLTGAGGDVQLLVLLAARLPRDGRRTQRPLLVTLTERVGAELTEGLRVFAADVAVVPGTVPASCRGDNRPFELGSDPDVIQMFPHLLQQQNDAYTPRPAAPLPLANRVGVKGAGVSHQRASW